MQRHRNNANKSFLPSSDLAMYSARKKPLLGILRQRSNKMETGSARPNWHPFYEQVNRLVN